MKPMSARSLQSDGFVSIGNAAGYGCAAFGCSEFACASRRGLTLSISLPVSVRQPIIHDLNILIHSTEGQSLLTDTVAPTF